LVLGREFVRALEAMVATALIVLVAVVSVGIRIGITFEGFGRQDAAIQERLFQSLKDLIGLAVELAQVGAIL
jgi:hypothetical protein